LSSADFSVGVAASILIDTIRSGDREIVESKLTERAIEVLTQKVFAVVGISPILIR
jgi:hypothetical protein